MNLTAKSNKAELHIQYECNLSCTHCNRMSFLRKAPTAPMTVADAEEFFRQCRELNWLPAVLLIGGEPTEHPDFREFVRVSREFATPMGSVQVWTNGYSERARAEAAWAEQTYGAFVPRHTFKPGGSVRHTNDDIFVSPVDYGKPQGRPCDSHASRGCGISVDHDGYTACAMGGALDGFLDLGVRTRRLADLFDPAKAQEAMQRLCAHCGLSASAAGHMWSSDQSPEERAAWRAYVEAQPKKYGSHMSPTWLAAAKDRR